jgi:hypothetical protein
VEEGIKMNEMQTFISWLERQNISFDRDNKEEYSTISVEQGYIGFVSYLTFDKDGKFTSIEAFE